MIRTGIYIDGHNFFYGALKGTSLKWVDLEKLSRTLLPRDNIQLIRYFTARIRLRPNDPQNATRQDAYIRALRTTPLVTVHEGRFLTSVKSKALADRFESHAQLFNPYFRPRQIYSLMWSDNVKRRTDDVTKARVIIDEEKGSDVNLGVHLINDVARGVVQKALVISNDSDLTEAIRLSTLFGAKIGILNPHASRTSRYLRLAASFEMPFRREIIERCQFPTVVRDSVGREIHKPRAWRQDPKNTGAHPCGRAPSPPPEASG